MPQLFTERANLIARASVLAGVGGVVAAFVLLGALVEPDYMAREGHAVRQPVPFSHMHHAGQLGIDCRYCHTSVEDSSSAGFPPTKTCMTCHSQVWAESPLLAPVRESFARNEPLQWNRVYNLPDFVFFDHSIHVNKGISCRECHGRVDKMEIVEQVEEELEEGSA